MAYHLRTDESVGKGLRRVVKKELNAAVDQLADAQLSDNAIHEARKSIKKVRAVLQLVGQDIDAGRALKRLRRAGRLLAPLRDAEAVMSSAAALCVRERRALSAKTCSELRDRLRRRKTRLESGSRRNRLTQRAAESLAQVQRSAKGWDWKTVGFSVFAAEIKRSYKRARQAMRKARNRNRSEAFHSWRKRVKTLWYALRLLEERVQPLRRQLTDLGRLEEWLGEDHNLLVLHTQLGRSPSVAGAARLKVFVERRQHALHRKALALGARQFRDAPAEFARHLQRMWRLRGQHAA